MLCNSPGCTFSLPGGRSIFHANKYLPVRKYFTELAKNLIEVESHQDDFGLVMESVEVADLLYFVATRNDGTRGLWAFDGTGSTLLLDTFEAETSYDLEVAGPDLFYKKDSELRV